jgi:hypothetical protein
LGLGYSPHYYGGYDGGYVASYGYPVYEEPPVVAVAPFEPPPPVEIPQWADEDLKELGLNKFCMTRGLDRDGNKVVLDVISKSFHDETGALHKAKMQVRWTEWKTVRCKDGTEHQVEKIKNDKFKLKFDEWGRFTEFDD